MFRPSDHNNLKSGGTALFYRVELSDNYKPKLKNLKVLRFLLYAHIDSNKCFSFHKQKSAIFTFNTI